MRKQFIAFFNQFDKKLIALDTLELLCPGDYAYEDFSKLIKGFVREGILAEYSGQQRSQRDSALCLRYRLNRYRLLHEDRAAIQAACLRERLPKVMDISYYLQEGLKEWEADYMLLQQIAAYLRRYGLPATEATDQERSYQIFGDEKVLLEGGRGILRKLGLDEKMKISNFADPLMLAVRPEYLQEAPLHHHMIVENKATYYAVLDLLPHLPLTSLVYGAGWKIAGNINCLPKQLGREQAQHCCWYFGDLDEEGIAIWHAVQRKMAVKVALPFYQALLKKTPSFGKENQMPNRAAREHFFSEFAKEQAQEMRHLLDEHGYYPQESLNKEDLLQSARRLAAEWI